MQHAVGGAGGEAAQPRVQLAGAEDGQHHALAEVDAAAGDADLRPHGGVSAVTAHQVVGGQGLGLPAVGLRGDGDLHTGLILGDGGGRPAEQGRDGGALGQAAAQHLLGAVLGQPLVGLEVIVAHQLVPRREVPVLAHQVAVGRDRADGVAGWEEAGGAQLVGDAPEVEVLQSARREVLALGDALGGEASFHQGAGDVAPAQLDGQGHAHRSPADDDHRVAPLHLTSSRAVCASGSLPGGPPRGRACPRAARRQNRRGGWLASAPRRSGSSALTVSESVVWRCPGSSPPPAGSPRHRSAAV